MNLKIRTLLFELPKIYPITDVNVSGLSHAEQVRRLIDGGAKLIQLREKHRPPGDWFDDAASAVKICRDNDVTVIINDRVDLALAVKADGVHLGQDDLDPTDARRLLGGGAIIGFSTHTIGQVRYAKHLPINYIGFGPVFPTKTKQNPDPTVGLEMLRDAVLAAGSLPVVAIGGIGPENLTSIFSRGADSAAVIGSLLSDPATISSRMRAFLAAGIK